MSQRWLSTGALEASSDANNNRFTKSIFIEDTSTSVSLICTGYDFNICCFYKTFTKLYVFQFRPYDVVAQCWAEFYGRVYFCTSEHRFDRINESTGCFKPWFGKI